MKTTSAGFGNFTSSALDNSIIYKQRIFANEIATRPDKLTLDELAILEAVSPDVIQQNPPSFPSTPLNISKERGTVSAEEPIKTMHLQYVNQPEDLRQQTPPVLQEPKSSISLDGLRQSFVITDRSLRGFYPTGAYEDEETNNDYDMSNLQSLIVNDANATHLANIARAGVQFRTDRPSQVDLEKLHKKYPPDWR